LILSSFDLKSISFSFFVHSTAMYQISIGWKLSTHCSHLLSLPFHIKRKYDSIKGINVIPECLNNAINKVIHIIKIASKRATSHQTLIESDSKTL
jgi:hypothetical protein